MAEASRDDLLQELERVKERLRILREKRSALEQAMRPHREIPGPPYTAVIVEPRKHKALTYVVQNILANLNSDWTVKIYHGTGNEEWLKEKLSGDLSGVAAQLFQHAQPC
jgi:hypothetical protein